MMMRRASLLSVVLAMISAIAFVSTRANPEPLTANADRARLAGFDRVIADNLIRQLEEGRLHQAIAGARLGGVGPGLSPAAALALGLKVDVEALPARLVQALRHGTVDLDDLPRR